MRGQRLLNRLFKLFKSSKNRINPASLIPNAAGHSGEQKLSLHLQQNDQTLRTIYANCSDVIYRSFLIAGRTKAMLVYIDGLADSQGLEDYVIAPLMNETTGGITGIKPFVERKISVSQANEFSTIQECIEYLSSGNPVLLCDNEANGLALGLSKWEKRSIEEPAAESLIRGPREGFTETLRTSTSQLRRIIKSPQLKMEAMKIGNYTQTNVVIAYVAGLVDMTLVEEIKTRLNRIQIDGVLESGYIEEMIEDNPYSPFPQLLSTERPDVVCGCLLEGRAAILVEGTPFVMVAPITLFSLLQAAEDYYQRFWIGTATRWLRYSFTLISLLFPSLYVAVLTFHQEMVPGSLLISMASSREAVPFPALGEALLMEITFEALREAGIRLPKQVGAAVSIVGALVIGQSAVQAGLVSAPMVIVVALTGISSFMVPRYIMGITIRLLRFPLIFLAGTLGLLGIMMGVIAIVIHLCSLRSFGIPYLSGVSNPNLSQLKDVLIRAPRWMLNERPYFTGMYDQYRQAPHQKPGPERGDEK
ncbi:spore germination protein [Paenibacillus sp. OAS669]|uniref:spore germination protein n=1 Tax=Paenibacillus sp. OAS669 TaxID=2663821 RepID=UPI00178AF74A